MMRIFFWFFLLLPLAEIYVLIKVGVQTGALFMLLWVILMVLAGGLCIRFAGLATALSVRQRVAHGELPDVEMLIGLLWFIAGVLFIIPGLITDFLGLLCILPLTRHWLIRRMRGHMVSDIHYSGRTHTHFDESQIIEGEYEECDKRPPK